MKNIIKTVLVLSLVFGAANAQAVERFVSLTGSDVQDCNTSQDVNTPLRTIDKGVICTQAGDKLTLRGGTWTERVNLQDNNKTGTAGNYITIAGYPGETVTLLYTDTGAYGAIKARGNRGYIKIENLIIDGSNYNSGTRNSIRDGNHHFWYSNVEIKNTPGTALYVEGDDHIIEKSYFHHTVTTDCAIRPYGLYIHHGSRIIVRENVTTQNPGGGMQVYPGPLTDINIYANKIYNNGSCPTTSFGGMVVSSDPSGTGGGSLTNINVYDNEIHDNGQAGYGGPGTGGNTGGPGHGIRTSYSFPTGSLSNVRFFNNLLYNNGGTGSVYGLEIQGGANNLLVQNNIVLNNKTGQIHDGGSGNTISFNLCKTADSCGVTGKVAVTDITDVTVSPTDFRLKQGTNPARNAGTTVSTRPAPVGVTDIGPREQGELAAIAANDGLDLTLNVVDPGLTPATGITGITASCVGCTGTPVVSGAALKSGTNNIVHAIVGGISVAGTCQASIGATNLSDSYYIGGLRGLSQTVNSATNFAAVGNCANTGGAVVPAGATAYYLLDEGTGTSAADASGNANTGTVSSGITWASVFKGSGLRIPTDATFRHLDTGIGASTNMATAAGGKCVLVKPDITQAQKVLFSSGGNGVGQRLYDGIATASGQLQWGIGVQNSGFTTGSEFPVADVLTDVCMQWGSGTVYLWVNGVKGTVAGKSVKTYTSYTTTATNFRFGNDGTFTNNNGGFDIDEPVVWTSAVSDATIQAYHTARFPTGGAATGYAQANHRAQLVHTYGGNPVDHGTIGGTSEVVENGSVTLLVQVDCTGGACAPIAVAPYYSTSVGGAFDLQVPASLGADGVAMYGSTSSANLNSGLRTSNISGALTNVQGSTMVTASTSPTISLAQDRSTVFAWVIRFGAIAGQTRCFKLKQDNGTVLAGGYTPANGACFSIVKRASAR